MSLLDIGWTAGGIGAGAVALKMVAGPSLQAVGKAFGDLTAWRMDNLLGLSEKLASRSEESGTAAGGAVHPHVLYEVLERGSWESDDVAQEYFAGVLLGSHTPADATDDRGTQWAVRIGNMSTFEIRAHWVIYAAALQIWEPDPQWRLTDGSYVYPPHQIIFPRTDFLDAVAPNHPHQQVVVSESIALLINSGLIGVQSSAAEHGPNQAHFTEPFDMEEGEPAVLVQLAPMGWELFKWALGTPNVEDIDELKLPASVSAPLLTRRYRR